MTLTMDRSLAEGATTAPFVCPACKGSLDSASDSFHCGHCRRDFPIILGIPDFRLFDDPYISIEDDRRKGLALAEAYESESFEQLVARYWRMTPGIPQDLVQEHVRLAAGLQDRSIETWKVVSSNAGRIGTESLLEIGCGTAGFLAGVGPTFTRAVGIDIAFRWLVVAKKRLEQAGVTNAVLACACAEYLPFPDGAFDVTVAEDVLDHTRNQEAFIKEGARVLKRGTGRFYLSTPNRFSLGPDPHVWIWGVGFLPQRFRDRYVRWRKGVAYGPIRPISHLGLHRLLKRASLRQHRMLAFSTGPGAHPKLLAWQRALARVYESLRGVPGVRDLLGLVGPSIQVICSKP